MFSEIFLPERVGTKRILSKKIISFSIQDNIVRAAFVNAKRSKIIIENLFEQKIKYENTDEYKQNAANTIQNILLQTKKYDQIKITIPSSTVIFKELSMPFTNKDKIRMILDYEVEPLIPFPIEDSIVDFIITKQIKTKQTSNAQILVAIVRKQELKNIIDIYNAANVKPNNISVDLFSIYSIYQQIEDYRKIINPTVLINIDHTSTQIAFLNRGQLRMTRFISNGIENIIRNVSKELNLTYENIERSLFTQELRSMQQNEFDKTVHKQLMNLFNNIQFTLNSFSSKLNIDTGINKIFLMGMASQIKGLDRFVNNLLQIQCENFKTEKIFLNKEFKNKVKQVIVNWNRFTAILGSAVPSNQHVTFDLKRKEFALPNMSLLKKQIAAAMIIGITIITTIGFNGYQQINDLLETSRKIEKTQITRLKSIFPKNAPALKKTILRSVLKDAEKYVNEKTEMWAPFAKQKVRPLEILQELTRIIDKRRFDVTVEQISIEDIENDSVKIEVDGFFRSKTGTKHFESFRELEKRFAESGTLKLAEEIDARPSEDEGIKFSAHLKFKEL